MDKSLQGWLNGFAGVLIFSGSLPATRIAVLDIDPLWVTLARAIIAGSIGMVLLLVSRQRLPGPRDIVPLVVVATGVIVGFPLLTALALRHMNASSSIVFTGLLPLSTAMFAVWRGAERPDRRFWLFAGLGGLLVAGFAWSSASFADPAGDVMMVAAVLLCGLGYAEGAVLSRRLGTWQVICWALVLSLPVMLLGLCFATPPAWQAVRAPAWWGVAYISLFSMLIGFMFWYRGLALGGIAAVGQLQLIQPLLALGIAAALLHEPVGWQMVVVLVAIVACVAGARHFSTRTASA